MIQADFFQFYPGLRFTLREMVRGESGMSTAEILSLVYSLPQESRFIAVSRGGMEFWGWTVTQYQLAQVIDAINDGTLVSMKAAGAKRAKPAQRFYRPDVKKKPKNNQFRNIAARRIAAARKRKAENNGEGSRRS